MIQLVEKYINFNKYFPNSVDFNEFYLSHPDYPSLFAKSDTLTFFGIENSVTKVQISQYDALPNNFLTYIKIKNEDTFIYIIEKSDESITFITERNTKTTISKEQFIKLWTGIILIVDENILKEDKKKIKNNWINIIYVSTLVIIYKNLFVSFEWISFFYSLFSLIGLFLSLLLLKEKFRMNNETSKICNVVENGMNSCMLTINSEGAKIYKEYTLTDACVIFFFTISLITIISSTSNLFFIPISILSIPIVAYSIWYQKFKLSIWCLLCIAISLILLSLSILSFFQFDIITLKDLAVSFLYFVLIFSLITILWVNIKPFIYRYFELKIKEFESNRFKLNAKTFNLLLLNSHKIETNIKYLKKIEIGNPQAELELCIFISPSCKYCSKTYSDSYKLVQQYPNKIRLSLYFNINIENDQNVNTTIATIITESYIRYGKEIVIKQLNDWFLNKLSLENFIKKYDIEISQNSKDIIFSHFEWCSENELIYTPIRVLNNFLIPVEYSVDELKYFIQDLSDKE